MFGNKKLMGVVSLLVIVITILSACAPATPQVVEKEVIVEKEVPVTVEVVKEKVVEKKVVETVEVVKEVVVEKKVIETVEVVKEVVVTATPVPSEPLKVVLGAEPYLLDPSIDIVKSTLVIDNTMLEPLVMNTRELSYEPWLAKSWEAVEPTRWRLHLRKGVRFHNGEVFNADAVAYSVKVYQTTKGTPRGMFAYITDTEKVDDYTIDIITDEPMGILPSMLAFLYVFPPEYHSKMGEDFGLKPVGTGPWRFVEWTKGVQIKVAPNPDYWGEKPSIGEVWFRWAPEGSSRVAMVETGEVHLAQNIPPALVERIERSDTARIETAKSLRKVFLVFNHDEGPTADVQVRKAINDAIDVESIIEVLFEGRAYGRDTGIVLEGMLGYEEGRLEPFKYDPELAKMLLAEAGYPDGFKTTLWHTIGRYMLDKKFSEAVAAQLAEVGIEVELRGMEVGAYFTKINTERVPGIHLDSCATLTVNPLWCAQFNFDPGGAAAYGGDERTGELLAKARATIVDEERAKVYQELEDYVYKERVSWIWLWHQQDIYGVSNKLEWKPRRDELLDLVNASWR